MDEVRMKPALSMPPWTVLLPEDASAPGVARGALDEWLRDADPQVRRDARSVVSELVADAVRHGRPPIELSVQQRGGRARIELADAGSREDRCPPEGWSQRIVAGLAACWGVRGDGAHIWFELSLREPDAADRSQA